MNPLALRIWLIITALIYYCAFFTSLKAVKRKVPGVLSVISYVTAIVLNIGIVAYNYFVNLLKNDVSYAPFVSMFQVLIFLSFCFFPVYLFVEKVCKCEGYESYFKLASAIVMTGPCCMNIADVWTFPPALQSVFFVPHIICYMLSYTLAAVAFLIVLRALLSGEDHDRAVICCARVLFPFMSCGMFLGAVWADQVWGDFWAWDIKECWSLCTWLAYMIALHLYRREKLKKYARLMMIIGFVLVVITFLFSNVLDVESVHSY